MPGTRCPDEAELARFAVGDLPLATWEQVARHVEDCPDCDAALDACDRGDPLLTRLREALPTPAEADVPQLLLSAACGARATTPHAWPAAELPRRLGKFELLRRTRRRLVRPRASGPATPSWTGRWPSRSSAPAGWPAARTSTASCARPAAPPSSSIPASSPLHETGQTDDGTCYLVEEFVAGRDAGGAAARPARSTSARRPQLVAAGRPTRSTTPTSTAWSTATSSRRTSCSTRTAGRT